MQVEIRKYPNRRYYDTARSSYVTLQEIRELICRGADIRVVDSKTEEDITARVLAQIILEHDATKLQIIPLDLLHELIRANDTLLRGFAESFYEHALFMFIESRRLFQRYLRLWGEMMPGGLLQARAPEPAPAKDVTAAVPAEATAKSAARGADDPSEGEESDVAVAEPSESAEPESAESRVLA
jgi:polyhydroxyalkanoate synthesis repressor PhaR